MLGFLNKIFDYVQGRAERRRNTIRKLEKEQDALKAIKVKNAHHVRRLDAISAELGRLYSEATSQA
jgi:hypothetical protein